MDQELVKTLKQMKRNSMLQMFFSFISAVCCIGIFVVIFTSANNIVPQVVSASEQLEDVAKDIQDVSEQLAKIDFEKMVDDVDQLVADSDKSVVLAIEKMEAIDVDGLNKAIKDLQSAIQPLAKFAKMFK